MVEARKPIFPSGAGRRFCFIQESANHTDETVSTGPIANQQAREGGSRSNADSDSS